MKLQHTLAALAATTMIGNAASIFNTLPGDDQAGFTAGDAIGTGAGQLPHLALKTALAPLKWLTA